jgi:CRISPR type I-E-associated protein CasA/Cse1
MFASGLWPNGLSPNLLDDPWIPVISAADGRHMVVGVRDLLQNAHEYGEIDAGGATTTAALVLLTAAIVGAAIPGEHEERVEVLRSRRMPKHVFAYLAKWRPRFDLASENGGFMQVKASDLGPNHKRAMPGKALFADVNDETDRKLYRRPPTGEMPWPIALRAMLERQMFDLGGPVTCPIPSDGDKGTHAKGSVAAGKTVVYAVGKTLLETLILNAPLREPGDAPSWEEEPRAGLRIEGRPGRLRAMTLPARSVLFEFNAAGDVAQLVFGPGAGYADSALQYHSAGFVAALFDAKKGEPSFPRMQTERSLWRWQHALLQQDGAATRLTAVENLNKFANLDEWWSPDVPVELRFTGWVGFQKRIDYTEAAHLAFPAVLASGSSNNIERRRAELQLASEAADRIVAAAKKAEAEYARLAGASPGKAASKAFAGRCVIEVGTTFQDIVTAIARAEPSEMDAVVAAWVERVRYRIRATLDQQLDSSIDPRAYAVAMGVFERMSYPKDDRLKAPSHSGKRKQKTP